MNELPESVKIGPYWYTIHWTRDEWEEAVASGIIEDATCLGHTNHDVCGIWIRPHARTGRPAMSNDQQRDTLLHEILHCCMRGNGVNIANVRDHSVMDLEEWVVSSTTPWLMMTMHDNPTVFAWIVNG